VHTLQAGRPARVIAVTLLLAGAAARVGVKGYLTAVAVSSAASAWAVGSKANARGVPETLIMRWTGRSWTRVPGPATPGGSELAGVAAVSARDAWAVGGGLILRWNGTTWM
jgi:hypothetical protein